MTDPVAERDAGVMAAAGQRPMPADAVTRAADVLMVRHVDEFWCDPGHRQAPPNRLMRDEIAEALLSERQRGREEMRDRAAGVADTQSDSDIGWRIATAIRSLSTED